MQAATLCVFAVAVTLGSHLLGGAAAAARPTPLPAKHWGYNYDRTALPCPASVVVANSTGGAEWCDAIMSDVLGGAWVSPEAGAAKLARDFGTMRQMGGDVVRVFINLDYIVSATRALGDGSVHVETNSTALASLRTVAHAAAGADLSVILTGSVVQDPDRSAAWLVNASDDVMAAARVAFWTAVATELKGTSGVFSFDLLNEPHAPWADTAEWVDGCFPMRHGRRFCYTHALFRNASLLWTQYVHAKFGTVQNLTHHWPDFPRAGTHETWNDIAIPDASNTSDPRWGAYDFGFTRQFKQDWCSNLTNAIRAVDPARLVTIGELFPQACATCGAVNAVDYYSVHLYPQASWANASIAEAHWAQAIGTIPDDGRSLVVEEFSGMVNAGPGLSMAGSIDAILNASSSRGRGWVSFYWGNATSLGITGVSAELYKEWLEAWTAGRPWHA